MTNTIETETPSDEAGGVSWKVSVALSVVILGVAGGIAAVTFLTEPTAQKGGATKKTAMLVDVVGVERGDHRPRIVATGTVEPAQEIVLRSQVAGRIVSLASGFAPGGHVAKDETLVKIESADFRHTLAQRQSDLKQALADLAVERGRQDTARADYEYLGEDLPNENQALVLRKPQLDAAKERVEAARAAVEQARLDVRRTTVKAPFAAHILRRDVNVGSQISPNDSLGRLVGRETYWVVVELPLSKLRWVDIPDDQDEEGAAVRIRNRTAWPEDTFRVGNVYKLVGALDGDTRMARVLVSVPDPLAIEAEGDEPALMIGEFVEANIRGKEIEDVVRLNRDHVRGDDTVWTMEEGKLQLNSVEIVMRDHQYAYVASGLEEGDDVVTTNLSTVVEGAPLRLDGAGDEGDE